MRKNSELRLNLDIPDVATKNDNVNMLFPILNEY